MAKQCMTKYFIILKLSSHFEFRKIAIQSKIKTLFPFHLTICCSKMVGKIVTFLPASCFKGVHNKNMKYSWGIT